MDDSYPLSRTNKIRQLREKASYQRETIYQVLDAGLVAQVAFLQDGAPGISSTWMKAGYGVCGAVAAQAESTSVAALLAMTLVIIKKCLLGQRKKAAQKLGGY